MARLGDHIKIVNGFAFKSKQYVESGIRVLRITNVQKGEIVDNDPKFYSEDSLKELERYSLDEGDLLMSLTGNVGRVGRVRQEHLPAYVNQRVCKIQSDSPDLDEDYLFHLLNSDRFERDAVLNSSGVAQLNLSTRWVENYDIELPPLETQRKIAAILDTADLYRQKTKALIDKYDELAQSLFLDMFGDPFKNTKGFTCLTLKDVVVKVQIGPFGSQLHQSDYITGGVPLINPTHIANRKVIEDKDFTIGEEKYSSLQQYHLKEGDIIMGRRGEMGRCALITKRESGWFCGTGSLYIRPSSGINSVFLLHALSGPSGKSYLEHEAKGVTMKNLNKSIIMSARFGLPPLDSQLEFQRRIEVIESQKEVAITGVAASEELFNSLLQRAFKGELE